MPNTYARWFTRAVIALSPLLVLGLVLFQPSTYALIVGGAFILTLLGWANAALKPLGMVFGPIVGEGGSRKTESEGPESGCSRIFI